MSAFSVGICKEREDRKVSFWACGWIRVTTAASEMGRSLLPIVVGPPVVSAVFALWTHQGPPSRVTVPSHSFIWLLGTLLVGIHQLMLVGLLALP